jgi:hypothetical protein
MAGRGELGFSQAEERSSISYLLRWFIRASPGLHLRFRPPASSFQSPESTRNKVRIEIAVTYSKQTRGTNSNRNYFRGPICRLWREIWSTAPSRTKDKRKTPAGSQRYGVTNHNLSAGEEKANRNTCQFKNLANPFNTQDKPISNRNKKPLRPRRSAVADGVSALGHFCVARRLRGQSPAVRKHRKPSNGRSG